MTTATMPAPTANGSDANLPAKSEARIPALVAHGDAWWNDSAKFQLIQRSAVMFSQSPLVPQAFQGAEGVGSCVIALNMAARMGADPLMVMQNLYVVHGRPSWSAQFLIACFNQTGRFAPIRYTWSGSEGKADWGCQAWSTDRATGERIEGPLVTIATSKAEGWYDKKGSKWQTIPRLMLMYRAASWLVRTHAPEIAMGLRTDDEERDIGDDRTIVRTRIDSVAELADQISGQQPLETTAVLQPVTADTSTASDNVVLSLAFLPEETPSAWQTRVLKIIGNTRTADEIDAIELDLHKLSEAEQISPKRAAELIEALNTQRGVLES